MVNWATTIFHDTVANPFVAGTAVHWYGATVETYDDGLDALHAVDTTKTILFDEGTADELGDAAFGKSSAAFQYSWMKDDFYWKKDDWDWGFWFANPVGGHIVYEPAYRYIRDIINGLNHADPCEDTVSGSLDKTTLSTTWTHYNIPIPNAVYAGGVISGFTWTAGAADQPTGTAEVTFYLDDIEWQM